MFTPSVQFVEVTKLTYTTEAYSVTSALCTQLGDFGLVTKQLTTATDDPSDLQEMDSESGEPSTAEGLGGGGGGNGGTMSYAAPELLFGMRPTTAVDMWATGCLAAEMIIGRVLFHASTFTQQVSRTCGLHH